jgi:hypothetical protein
MPISSGLDATAAWQAAALAAQLGGSQANISAHLTRLRQSGVIPAGRMAAPSTTASPSLSSAACYRPLGSCSPRSGSEPPKKGQNGEKTQWTNR